MLARTVADVGEKALISKVVRPLFDRSGDLPLIGNDCAVLSAPPGADVLLSTDRVPADLISFRLGLIDHYELGRYLAFLNISDIAACGGKPAGLLLNMGVPSEMLVSDFEAVCRGANDVAREYGCRVVGGDISGSAELSLSATSVGFVDGGHALTRSGARPGDYVFISRPLGLTPAAFAYFLGLKDRFILGDAEVAELRRQFTHIVPLVDLGRWLRHEGQCTSCMDNTDGVAQSFFELAAESGVAIVLDLRLLKLPEIVRTIARESAMDAVELALGPGADFSLVGTVSASPDVAPPQETTAHYHIVGRVEDGAGVHLKTNTACRILHPKGWDYFVSEVNGKP